MTLTDHTAIWKRMYLEFEIRCRISPRLRVAAKFDSLVGRAAKATPSGYSGECIRLWEDAKSLQRFSIVKPLVIKKPSEEFVIAKSKIEGFEAIAVTEKTSI